MKQGKPPKQSFPAVLTTEQIRQTLKIDRTKNRNRYAVPVSAPLELPEAELLVHPYVLGVWLGDGHSYSAQITVHQDDLEIADHLRECGVKAYVRRRDRRSPHVCTLQLVTSLRDPRRCRRGHDLERLGRTKQGYCAECARQYSKAHQYGYVVDPIVAMPDTLSRRLNTLGLLRSSQGPNSANRKQIPAAYLRASFGQRLALLQGLMDTDGHVDKRGRCEFTTTSPEIAEGFGELLATLGIKFTRAERYPKATYNGQRVDGAKAWRFSFLVYEDMPVFRLRRKLARQPGRHGRRTSETERRRIVAVEPVESVPVRCIQVDSPNHLYLAGRGMVPTHNTEVLLNTAGFHIDQDPAPIMVVMPTERDAETWSKDRFSTMARDMPCLRGRISDPKSRDGSNKILHKKFPGGHLTIVGANAPSGLASRPIRVLLCDEVDRYPPSAGAEGDPVNLARKRTVTFWNRKIVLVSTPTIKGASRIDAAWQESDQRRYWVPCPDCNEHQVLRWEQVRWEQGRPETAAYVCEHCGSLWSDAKRWAAIRRGEWRAETLCAGIAGFHLNEIYSSWVRLETMARTFLSAREHGEEAMKTFVNTSLGEVYELRGEAPDWQRLYERREDWKRGTVPMGGLLLTAGADVQRDRIEVDIWAWGRGLESWLVDHLVFEGDPGGAEVWEGVTALLGETWPHAGGGVVRLARLAIDTGGEHTAVVYSWARRQGAGQVVPIKGRGGFDRSAPVSGPTYVDATEGGRKIRRGVRLWTVSVSVFKNESYRFLRLARPTDEELAEGKGYPPGTIHLPRGIDAEWIKQLVAEQLVTVKTRRGFPRLEWQKIRERNEALDCRVYARAAAWLAGIDRWSERKWRNLERQLGIDVKETQEADSPGNKAGAAGSSREAVSPDGGTTTSVRRPAWLGGRQRHWLRRH